MTLLSKTIKYIAQPEHFPALVRKIYYEIKFKNGLQIGLFSTLKSINLGKNIFLGANVNLKNTTIGDYSYVNDRTSIKNTTIGKFCSIGSNSIFGLGQHPIHFVSTSPMFYANNKGFKTFANKMYFKETGERISVGNDVWVGRNVTLMDGVKIGDGAIIATHSVVTKDVKPYAIVGGIPAKVIKYRFDLDTINRLLMIKWWDLESNFLEKNYTKFHDVQTFLASFEDENNFPPRN